MTMAIRASHVDETAREVGAAVRALKLRDDCFAAPIVTAPIHRRRETDLADDTQVGTHHSASIFRN